MESEYTDNMYINALFPRCLQRFAKFHATNNEELRLQTVYYYNVLVYSKFWADISIKITELELFLGSMFIYILYPKGLQSFANFRSVV